MVVKHVVVFFFKQISYHDRDSSVWIRADFNSSKNVEICFRDKKKYSLEGKLFNEAKLLLQVKIFFFNVLRKVFKQFLEQIFNGKEFC